MRARRAIATAAVLLAAATACGKSEAEQQADCQAAITEDSTKTNRPEACESLSQEDYDLILMHWVLTHDKEAKEVTDWLLDEGAQ